MFVSVAGYAIGCFVFFFFFSSRRRHTRLQGDWSSDVCSSDLGETRITHERGLTVEIKVVFPFQNVVEHAETAADARFSTPRRVPGKSEAGREVILDGKVRTLGNTAISRENHSQRRIHKPLRLLSGNYRKGAPLRV